jgi:putative phage-type endonuclease
MTEDDIQLDAIFNKYVDSGLESLIKNVVDTFGIKYSPTFVSTRIDQIKKTRKILKKLLKIPVIEQRSVEWHDVRNNLITSSDMGQALGVGKFGNVRDLYVKKSGYENVPFGTFPALEWGVKYEPVATKIYEKRQNTHINEFGLVKHPKINFFGASPDGITDNGVMLEIKCPYKRKIDGHIVDQYYHQMQGQLEVCNLEECDFLECSFQEYFDEIDFNEDWNTDESLSCNGYEKGVILVFSDNQEGMKYIYSEPGDTYSSLNNWFATQEQVMKKYKPMIVYYKLNVYNLQKVYRDKVFFKENISKLKTVWDNILRYRSDKSSYDIEVGKKIVKKRPVKCLFNMTDML